MEKKALLRRVRFLAGIMIVMLVVLVTRLAVMQLIESERYRLLATQNHQRLIPVLAPRGEIFDRNGERIVTNQPVYTVSVTYLGLADTAQLVEKLSGILAQDPAYAGMKQEEIAAEIQKRLNEQKLRLYEPVPVAINVAPETATRIEEQRLELPGVIVDVQPVRSYPYGTMLAHVLGYVQKIQRDQWEKLKDEGYQIWDMYGQSGLENMYERYLRGQAGARRIEVDAQGRPVRDLGVQEPVPGDSLVLTIDRRLQEVAEQALAQAIKLRKAPGGAVVVMNVQTGEILAMASYPAFDPGVFTRGLSADYLAEANRTKAFFNRALGSYPPGSTFKMVTAAAALSTGKADASFTIYDPGVYKHIRDSHGSHGSVNMLRALQVSCNVYFAMLGQMVGAEDLARYAREFGLGQKTGIDLPGEASGILPTAEFKRRFNQPAYDSLQEKIRQKTAEYDARIAAAATAEEKAALRKAKEEELRPLRQQLATVEFNMAWHEYDTLNMAIGQGDNSYTPLQLVRYVAAIANGGVLYRPYLVQKIVAPDGEVLVNTTPQVERRIDVPPQVLAVIREGMRLVTMPGGTAGGVFAGAPYTVAGKTGTAQVYGYEDHALFVAFAPYEKPEIAVAVVVEHGGFGAETAAPVARSIFDAYFRLKNEAPTAGTGQETVRTAPAASVSWPHAWAYADGVPESKTAGSQFDLWLEAFVRKEIVTQRTGMRAGVGTPDKRASATAGAEGGGGTVQPVREQPIPGLKDSTANGRGQPPSSMPGEPATAIPEDKEQVKN